MIEEWKWIAGYEDAYMVSNMGRIKSLKWQREKILKTFLVGAKRYRIPKVALSMGKSITTVSVHRLVAEAFIGPVPKGMVVDHINNNQKDNRLTNLRICTPRENTLNSRPSKDKASMYKGVYTARRKSAWSARITSNGKHYRLGVYETEIEAAIAYNKAAIEHFGEYAWLNIINEAA